MIFYTTHEGGFFYPLERSMKKQSALRQLKKKRFGEGRLWFSKLTFHIVHSVLFEDGTRWDALNGHNQLKDKALIRLRRANVKAMKNELKSIGIWTFRERQHILNQLHISETQ